MVDTGIDVCCEGSKQVIIHVYICIYKQVDQWPYIYIWLPVCMCIYRRIYLLISRYINTRLNGHFFPSRIFNLNTICLVVLGLIL